MTCRLNWKAVRGKCSNTARSTASTAVAGKAINEARKQAEAVWRATKAQLDLEAEEATPHRTEYKNLIAEWESVLRWCIDHGEGMTAAVSRDKIKALEG
ncbi:hypothetical protein [Gimesia panareensis]|uniref:hypothetical protein n=1 Tax=Gimesia panareensis TaxID=2527978 RepID=UPI0011A604BB|nr:hypothetical protein [Gimesia panareensis]